MKSKKIILLVILLLALVGLTTFAIRAWLTDTDTTGDTTFTVGDVEYTWAGATIADTTKIVPGQNLIATSYTLTNGSNIETELRVKITMTSSYLAGDASSIIDLTMGTGWVQSGDYWYLQGSPAVEASGKYSIPATATTPITVVTSIILDGSLVGNVYSTTTITINFLFEAKQTDYVTWAELGSANIDFSTGLAA